MQLQILNMNFRTQVLAFKSYSGCLNLYSNFNPDAFLYDKKMKTFIFICTSLSIKKVEHIMKNGNFFFIAYT